MDLPLHDIYTVSQNKDTDVAYYNFNAHQPIFVIFGREWRCLESMLANSNLLFHLS